MKIEFTEKQAALVIEALDKHYGGQVYIGEMQPDKRPEIEKTLSQIEEIKIKFDRAKENQKL